MSNTQVSRRRYARRAIDLAVREVFSELRGNRRALAAFDRLLIAVRSKSSLLNILEGGTAAFAEPVFFLRGLFSLARNQKFWLRSPEDWPVTGSSRLAVFSSLVNWLLANADVPPFMIHVWLMEPSAESQARQTLYRHLARGFSIRGAKTPFPLTRRMEASFHDAPDDSSVESAFEWARNCRVQQRKTRSRPPNRQVSRKTLKRQTVSSSRLLRREWRPVPIRDFRVVDPPEHEWSFRSWSVKQILDSSTLKAEGDALYHCVACYEWECRRGDTSIWSMMTHGTLTSRHVLTIEVAPKERRIVQARGRCNAAPTEEARRVMMKWAEREGLSVASSV